VMTPGEYARLISSFAGDKEIILLINEVKVQLMGVEEFSGLVGSIPENVSIGLDNCYLGNDILNYLSLIDFRIACLSEHIIRNLHLFPERIKIINGLKLFTDELGIPLLARNILVEEEFQIIRDLRIPFATGAYLATLEQSDPQ
jgi:EAL domain-containing protein (putative c-di-GMP-specific phosphodiesterase class I)